MKEAFCPPLLEFQDYPNPVVLGTSHKEMWLRASHWFNYSYRVKNLAFCATRNNRLTSQIKIEF
jgi:hypothetical protein